MNYTEIYYYGLLFSFVMNAFVLYVNVYHNEDVPKSLYGKMVVSHAIIFLLSWVGIILYVLSFIILELQKKPGKRK